MNLNDLLRLEASRIALQKQRLAVEKSSEAGLADTLRPALDQALAQLRLLHRDAPLWDAASRAVDHLADRGLGEVRADYATSLPPLLDLFGYEAPPSAAQVIRETLASLDDIGSSQSRAGELNAAHEALGAMLTKTDHMAEDPPWRLAQRATEVNGYLELGIGIGLGATLGGAAAAFATVAGGAVTGGIGPIAGFVVFGGVRRFQHVRAVQEQVERLSDGYQNLTANVFPAAAGAILQYLNEVIEFSSEGSGGLDLNSPLRVSDGLDTVVEIARRFVLAEPRLATVVSQASLRNDFRPRTLLPLLRGVHGVADRARVEQALNGALEGATQADLRRLRDALRAALPAQA
ncbi:hypothetical protein acdb102_21690 [Acidothermaceae bacterium B102]|nr:hypothetical protein acdb102_21690 [Acidothermaceae bacterium B102]